MQKVLIINGPNLNMLGYRDSKVYGDETLEQLVADLHIYAQSLEIELEVIQTNYEGEIIEAIHNAYFKDFLAIIINAGAYTHYSYAIKAALEIFNNLKIEVHLSDINKREEFRKNRVFEDVVDTCFMGEGKNSYYHGLDYIKRWKL